ncbi:MAG: hypothetical protein ABJI60_13840 [Kangiellaceae bacterium]|jgi:hypothetical protein
MHENSHHIAFQKFAAVCSLLGAITTALLIFLPNPEAADFESSVQLHQNTLYLSKLWILFIHPQVNIIASFGIALILFRKRALYIIPGSFFLMVWAYTEMSQQALLIDGLNQFWRPGFLSAEDESAKAIFSTLITGASGISDSKYFLVIYGFGVGSFLFGLALISELALGKWIGVALIFIGVLSFASFLRYYMGITFLSPIVNWCYVWIYPYLQPLVRIAIGVWLFNHALDLSRQNQLNKKQVECN